MYELFADRRAAGRELARCLGRFGNRADAVVLGLPRGGIPVAYEVARSLDAPLDAFVVRKLRVPWREELAMGALASGGACVLNGDVIDALAIDRGTVDEVIVRERWELRRRERLYRGVRAPIEVARRTAIVVDDGLATGASMRAAVAALRERGARAIVVAVPVGSPATCAQLADAADEVMCATTPEPFIAVGAWYRDFSPTGDAEVRLLLERSAEHAAAAR
jgi:putative phosphoribosyl transferase